jgi:hypothetical protein
MRVLRGFGKPTGDITRISGNARSHPNAAQKIIDPPVPRSPAALLAAHGAAHVPHGCRALPPYPPSSARLSAARLLVGGMVYGRSSLLTRATRPATLDLRP